MDRVACGLDHEVIDQISVPVDGLCPDTSTAGDEILRAEGGDEPAGEPGVATS